MNNSVPHPEYPLAQNQLPLTRGSRINRLLQGLIQRCRSKASSGHGREHLDLALVTKILRNPFAIKPDNHLLGGQTVVER